MCWFQKCVSHSLSHVQETIGRSRGDIQISDMLKSGHIWTKLYSYRQRVNKHQDIKWVNVHRDVCRCLIYRNHPTYSPRYTICPEISGVVIHKLINQQERSSGFVSKLRFLLILKTGRTIWKWSVYKVCTCVSLRSDTKVVCKFWNSK